jgi:hypothetical protein
LGNLEDYLDVDVKINKMRELKNRKVVVDWLLLAQDLGTLRHV